MQKWRILVGKKTLKKIKIKLKYIKNYTQALKETHFPKIF
jgi:hypothetical protein